MGKFFLSLIGLKIGFYRFSGWFYRFSGSVISKKDFWENLSGPWGCSGGMGGLTEGVKIFLSPIGLKIGFYRFSVSLIPKKAYLKQSEYPLEVIWGSGGDPLGSSVRKHIFVSDWPKNRVL